MNNFNYAVMVILLLVSVVNIIGAEKRILKITWVTKPLLIPLIIIIYSIDNPAINWWLIVGLIFGMGGDVLLIGHKKFLLGLVSFLFGHIVYIIVFLGTINSFTAFELWYILLILPYAIIAIFIFKNLKEDLGKMFIPTLVYMLIIMFMSLSALLIALMVTITGGWITYFGSILFVLSDAILAWNKFHKKVAHAQFWILSTYIIGQFLIALGFML